MTDRTTTGWTPGTWGGWQVAGDSCVLLWWVQQNCACPETSWRAKERVSIQKKSRSLKRRQGAVKPIEKHQQHAFSTRALVPAQSSGSSFPPISLAPDLEKLAEDWRRAWCQCWQPDTRPSIPVNPPAANVWYRPVVIGL